jgi:peroxiredoxin
VKKRTSILLLALVAVSVVGAASQGPTAFFAAYRVPGESAATVLLDASSSTDPDGTILAYQWVFGDGTSGSGAEVVHVFPRVDRFEVGLLVFDDGGAWHRITRTVDLASLPTQPETDANSTASADAVPANVPFGNAVGERAPDFALPDIDGVTTYLSDFLGKVVLLEFWKSSCPGCQASVVVLASLLEEYGEQGLEVVLVTLDSSTPPVRQFLDSRGLTGLVALREPQGFSSDVVWTYHVSATPTLFLLDRTGVIRYRGYGADFTAAHVLAWL